MDKFVKGGWVRFRMPLDINIEGMIPGTLFYGKVINTTDDNVWIRHQEHNGSSLGIFVVPRSCAEPGIWEFPPPPEPIWRSTRVSL